MDQQKVNKLYGMSATELIFIKFSLAIQTYINNYNIKFNENPTIDSVNDTRSQTGRQTYVAST